MLKDCLKKVTVPEGQSGDWHIKKRELKKSEVWKYTFKYGDRAPSPGTYTRLIYTGKADWQDPLVGATIVMSDTPAEQLDHLEPVENAYGNILINGLGLGMVLMNCLDKTDVTHATVIEMSQNVINLVAGHYQEQYDDRLTIIHADALEWEPPNDAYYNMVWHDIWPSICADNWESMEKLINKYDCRCDWQGAWVQEKVVELRERDRTGSRKFHQRMAMCGS